MTVLRVLLTAAPAADRAEAWALFDAAGTMRAHRARSSGRLAKGGQGRGRARRGPGARGARHAAAAARFARRRCRALCARRPAGRARRHASHRGLGAGKGWRHSRGGRLAIPAGEHRRKQPWRRADRRRAGTRASRRGLDLVRARRRTPRALSAAPTAALSRSTRRRPTAGCRPSWPWRWRRPVAADRRLHASASMRHLPRRRSRAGNGKPASTSSRARPWRWEAAPPAAFADAIDLLPASRARSGSVARGPGATLCPRARAGRRRALPPCRCHRRRMGVAAL